MKWWWVVGIMWGSGEVVVVVTSLLQAAVRGPARLQHCSTAAAGDPRPIFSQGSINCAAASSCRSCCSCWPQLGPFTRPPPPHHLTYLVPGNHNTTAASPVEALCRGHVHLYTVVAMPQGHSSWSPTVSYRYGMMRKEFHSIKIEIISI